MWKLALVELTVGGQKVLRGTEIQLVFSPSRARASSRINFPSEREQTKKNGTISFFCTFGFEINVGVHVGWLRSVEHFFFPGQSESFTHDSFLHDDDYMA